MIDTSLVSPVLACPGCSMYNLMSFRFQNPGDVKWGLLIILGTIAVPLILYAFGLRPGPKRVVTRSAVRCYAGFFYMGWLIMAMNAPYSPNFAVFLMHWL